jgi:hypothetical protein
MGHPICHEKEYAEEASNAQSLLILYLCLGIASILITHKIIRSLIFSEASGNASNGHQHRTSVC